MTPNSTTMSSRIFEKDCETNFASRLQSSIASVASRKSRREESACCGEARPPTPS